LVVVVGGQGLVLLLVQEAVGQAMAAILEPVAMVMPTEVEVVVVRFYTQVVAMVGLVLS
jgi:hypothetical protein